MRAVELLIAAKVQVNIQQKVIITASQLLVVLFGFVQDGWTALYIASQEGHCGVVRMLLEAKADVNVKTNVSHAAWWCLCTLIPWLSVCTVTSVHVSLVSRPIFFEGGKGLVSIAWVLVRMVIVH